MKNQDQDAVQEAREAAVRGAHASRYWEELLKNVFGDIEQDYLSGILTTNATDSDGREHLYRCTLALHDVRRKLMEYDTYGNNAGMILDKEQIHDEENNPDEENQT